MPELAEVAYYSRRWDAGLHKRVVRVHAHEKSRVFRGSNGRLITRSLTGAVYLQPFTHGKNLLFSFSGGLWLGGHLGMTGELLADSPDFTPGKHDHLVLFTADSSLVYRDPRMFGRWRIDRSNDPPEWWRTLPPEIMAREFTIAHVADILRRRPRAALKTLLLDQSLFPGIGNWMADETLWQLKLHPAVPAGSADAAALRNTLRSVTRTALRTIGRDWSDPPRSWLFRHRWETDGKCPRCGQTLQKGGFGGRTARWCPKCQVRP